MLTTFSPQPKPADPWHFSRAEWAYRILTYLPVTQGVTIVGERGSGKTAFLQRDLLPLASQHGLRPIVLYLRDRGDDASVALLEGLLDPFDIAAPTSSSADSFLTARALDASATGRISEIYDRLCAIVASVDQRVLLVVDDLDEIGTDIDGSAIAGVLRAFLQTHSDRIWPCFTASPVNGGVPMLDDMSEPFYLFGPRVPLPSLDLSFIDHMAARLGEVAPQLLLDRDRLFQAFIHLGCSPRRFRALIEAMNAGQNSDIEGYLQGYR